MKRGVPWILRHFNVLRGRMMRKWLGSIIMVCRLCVV